MAWYRCSGGGSNVEAIVDQSEYIADTFINPNTGAESPTGGWCATPFIEVTPDEVLTLATKVQGQYYFSWYDANKTWLNSFTLSDIGYMLLTVPSNAYYVRFSHQQANMLRFMAWRGL